MFLFFLVVCICCSELEKDSSTKTIDDEKVIVNSKDITLITAFFDVKVGRRSKDIYFSYFKNWARIKNRLIAFCQNERDKEEILRIRRNYQLESKTSVTVIENLFNIEEDMYNRMVEISKNVEFLNFRVYKKMPENTAEYNYVMVLKCYFLNKANVEYEIKTENLGWLDFGWDHGGEIISHGEDWLFNLECNTSGKINLFYLPPKLDERPLFEIIRTCHSHPHGVDKGLVTGGFFVCPKILVNTFWTLMKESMYELLYLGLMDDDQVILLLASRRKPQIFELKLSDWFHPLKDHCNGHHMRLKQKDYERRHHHHHRNQQLVKGEKRVDITDI